MHQDQAMKFEVFNHYFQTKVHNIYFQDHPGSCQPVRIYSIRDIIPNLDF